MKELIKKIPIIGWFIRWINTLLRLNNLKFIILEQQKRINEQEKRINEQEKRINEQEKRINEQSLLLQKVQNNLDDLMNQQLEKKVNEVVSHSISFQTNAMQERIDQFIFDNKIDLKKNTLFDEN